jgi:hypothetical protein
MDRSRELHEVTDERRHGAGQQLSSRDILQISQKDEGWLVASAIKRTLDVR